MTSVRKRPSTSLPRLIRHLSLEKDVPDKSKFQPRRSSLTSSEGKINDFMICKGLLKANFLGPEKEDTFTSTPRPKMNPTQKGLELFEPDSKLDFMGQFPYKSCRRRTTTGNGVNKD